jgi:hypothetical protein
MIFTLGMSDMKQKDDLEYYAVHNFIAEYNRTHKRQIHFIRTCTPQMPDTLCRIQHREIGIEVVHTYGTDVEAAIRLGNKNSENFPDEIHLARMMTRLDIRALNSLNKVLANKATRTYGFVPTWLLVRNAFVHWSLRDYQKHKRQIHVPDGHSFVQIWLLCDSNSVGSKGIMRLT